MPSTISRTTIKSLAADCGVSAQTVSRIVNGQDLLHRPETVQKVRAAMARLGFLPSSSARSMRSGRTGVVALLQQAGGGSYLPYELLDGISERLEAIEMQLGFARLGISPDGLLAQVPRILCERRADALLVNLSGAFCERLEREIDSKGFPSVWLNVERRFDSVSPDDFAAGQAAAAYLAGQGAKDIFYIHTAFNPHFSSKARFEGVASGSKRAGIRFRHLLGNFNDAALKLDKIVSSFRRDGLPDGIAGYTIESLVPALSAVSALAGAKAAAKLPRICFGAGQMDGSALYAPCLRIPFREMGCAAVDMLAAKLAGPAAPAPSVKIPFADNFKVFENLGDACE